MTLKKEASIKKLEEFKSLLYKYRNKPTIAIRSEINKSVKAVQELVIRAGTQKTVTISPPPMIGGYMLRNVNPFDLIFEAPYGMDLTSVLADMVDETLGVIEHDENFFEQVDEDSVLDANESSINSKKVFLVHGA